MTGKGLNGPYTVQKNSVEAGVIERDISYGIEFCRSHYHLGYRCHCGGGLVYGFRFQAPVSLLQNHDAEEDDQMSSLPQGHSARLLKKLSVERRPAFLICTKETIA
jgi:hypothetical protein